jgi:hypothetical protein
MSGELSHAYSGLSTLTSLELGFRITSIAKCLQKLILSVADLAYVFLAVTKDCISHFVCCL